MAGTIVFAHDGALFQPRLTFLNADGSAYALAGTQNVKIYKQDGTLLKSCTLGDGIGAVGSNTIDLAVAAATMAGLGSQYLTVESWRTDVGPIFQGSFSVRCLAAGESAGTDESGVVTLQFGAVLVQVSQVNTGGSSSSGVAGLITPSAYALAGDDITATITSDEYAALAAGTKPVLVRPGLTNAGSARIQFNAGPFLTLKSPRAANLAAGELQSDTSYLLAVNTAAGTAEILTGSFF